jgi:serine/threonine-protein kinase
LNADGGWQGEVLGGTYELLEQIGAGGTGLVYEAVHQHLERRVAIKLLQVPNSDYAEEFWERFDREAKVMARLDHPHAVEVYDYGEHEGTLYIVMDYLSGTTLYTVMEGGALELQRASLVAKQLSDVLTTTHEMDLVHRDIKPSNIFVDETEDGPHATLVDFGLAFIATDEELNRVTREGRVLGTPQFISPEQARGDKVIPPASDIYALGCVIYEMVCGDPVVQGEAVVDVLNAHLAIPVTSLRVRAPEAEIPATLDTFVMSMLSKESDERPTAIECATFFRKLLASDDLRERGRPARFLQSRSARSVPASDDQETPVAVPEAGGDSVRERTLEHRLGVVGELDDDLIVAAHRMGWEATPYEKGRDYDVVVVLDPDDVTPDIASRHPTIGVVGSLSIQRAVELLERGVEDVVATSDPQPLMRHVAGVRQSRQRRGDS